MMSSDQYPGGSGGVDLPPPPPPTAGGLLGGLGAHQPASHQLSPYLNVNQNYLQTQVPEFLVNQEQRKGRIERSFTGIGGSVIVGSAVGGAYGLFDGVRQTALAGMKGKLRRTQIMNYTMKSGGSVANSLGSIAVIYSFLHTVVSQWHEEDDEAKSLFSGAATGALYKSSAGAVKCATGAAFGLGVAAVWAFLLKKDERVSYYV